MAAGRECHTGQMISRYTMNHSQEGVTVSEENMKELGRVLGDHVDNSVD